MSTSETVDFPICSCPCGNGKIIKSVTTQDNPWSSADIDYYIGCNDCSKVWQIEYQSLVSREEATAAKKAANDYWSSRENLLSLINPLADNYFERLSAPSMAAEHREMCRLGISSSDIRNYRRLRNSGQSFSSICDPLRNAGWVKELISGSELHVEYEALFAAMNDADANKRQAEKAIKRLPIIGSIPRTRY
ncbi:hypothetical protein [Pseudooceanicola spongiae]|uniref:Uncharacterized protein n=1 Tax=Pseudooceanicola spongiae TaxID=2613965 RepID=A0A7L9WMB9_9RHOB|nr:hypothetical protein [Pseudooceanicola spongiae]QOL80526.1 hypothetical protein F3W81_06710 [Pseudooceanicola spongiae]